jgi:GTPase SAR1 family protein
MPNARDAFDTPTFQKILVLGKGGSGKTSQFITLPGKKFVYLFDPGSRASIEGIDIDYEEFLPDAGDLDLWLRGFNTGSKSDTPKKGPGIIAPEPRCYFEWAEDFNQRVSDGFFANYAWIGFDSLTLLSKAMMDRQLFLNNRYGGIEDRADYRITGSKIGSVFRSICSMPNNIYATGHLTTFENEKTKILSTEINLPGSARTLLPLLFTNIWEARATTDGKNNYVLITKPEQRGFQEIRTSLLGLNPVEDVVIKDFKTPEKFGIGRMLSVAKNRGNILDARNRTVALAEKANQTPTATPESSVAAAA